MSNYHNKDSFNRMESKWHPINHILNGGNIYKSICQSESQPFINNSCLLGAQTPEVEKVVNPVIMDDRKYF